MKALGAILHWIYLPFTEEQMRSHFADIKQGGKFAETFEKHIKDFKKSIIIFDYSKKPMAKNLR